MRRRARGLENRTRDLLDRLQDQVLEPLEQQRRHAERVITSLRSLEAPTAEVDVNPLTRQLARRLQQRSILYLIGPQRILDRVRQVPSMLARLPRTAWDLIMTGSADLSALSDALNVTDARQVPDFRAVLTDQFSVLQTQIQDTLGITGDWKVDPARAGTIADEALAELNDWLAKRWNATPRDTAILMKLLRHLPGGEQITRWSEAAPYLLAIIVATHHAFFGHIDLMILGGYSLATWLTERLSNEVASRTRLTNQRIARRFEKLAHEQIQAACEWMDKRAASRPILEKLKRLAEELGSS